MLISCCWFWRCVLQMQGKMISLWMWNLGNPVVESTLKTVFRNGMTFKAHLDCSAKTAIGVITLNAKDAPLSLHTINSWSIAIIWNAIVMAPLVSSPGVQHYSDSGLIWLIIKVYSFLWRYHWRRWTLVCLFMLYCDRSRCVKWLRNLVIFIGLEFSDFVLQFHTLSNTRSTWGFELQCMGCSFYKSHLIGE